MEGGMGGSDFFDFVFRSGSGILWAMDAYANLPIPEEARPRLAELAGIIDSQSLGRYAWSKHSCHCMQEPQEME
jgi:hypothetical protein